MPLGPPFPPFNNISHSNIRAIHPYLHYQYRHSYLHYQYRHYAGQREERKKPVFVTLKQLNKTFNMLQIKRINWYFSDQLSRDALLAHNGVLAEIVDVDDDVFAITTVSDIQTLTSCLNNMM